MGVSDFISITSTMVLETTTNGCPLK